MLDLEAMGIGSNAAITAIGAVAFSNNKIESEFYESIHLETSMSVGLTVEAQTIEWWMKQDENARKHLYDSNKVHLPVALVKFSEWINTFQTDAKVWGNGAAFDNVVLRNAYTACRIEAPWKFWNDRCYRTMKSLYEDVTMRRVGTYHNALDDAKSQALHLQEILREDEIELR
jgi:exodeoxyribonuclease VIII